MEEREGCAAEWLWTQERLVRAPFHPPSESRTQKSYGRGEPKQLRPVNGFRLECHKIYLSIATAEHMVRPGIDLSDVIQATCCWCWVSFLRRCDGGAFDKSSASAQLMSMACHMRQYEP